MVPGGRPGPRRSWETARRTRGAVTRRGCAVEALAVRRKLLELTERLVEEHNEVPAGSVIRCFARCRDELLGAGVRSGLVDAVEAMARHRLRVRSGPVPPQRRPSWSRPHS